MSHKSPLAVYTKIVLAIRSFNYKWEAVKLVFSLSAATSVGIHILAYGQNIPSES